MGRPRRPRRHIRHSPYHTKPTSERISWPTRYAHQRTNTEAAIQNRIGNTVKVHNQASKQASAPKVMVRSRNHGTSRKFFSRSNLMALDSYGMSLVYEWWIYSGLGRCPASSNCNRVGMDIGGSGIEGGTGDGGVGSGLSLRDGAVALLAVGRRL